MNIHTSETEFLKTEVQRLRALVRAQQITIDKLEAQPEQEPVGWKLVPIKPTDEMLKAMDECSTEGYDERLYAGHAASVYMAAVDVAPTPPQRKPLTDEEIDQGLLRTNYAFKTAEAWRDGVEWAMTQLREKNAP